MTNCINCGAPISVKDIECSYCKTPYLDISYIPLNKPFTLKINLGTDENPNIVVQKVMLTSLDMSRNSVYDTLHADGIECMRVVRAPEIEYQLNLRGLY